MSENNDDQSEWSTAISKTTKRNAKSQIKNEIKIKQDAEKQIFEDAKHRTLIQDKWITHAADLKERLTFLDTYLSKIVEAIKIFQNKNKNNTPDSELKHFYSTAVEYWNTLEHHVEPVGSFNVIRWSAKHLSDSYRIWTIQDGKKNVPVQKFLMNEKQRNLADECEGLQRSLIKSQNILLEQKDSVMSFFTSMFDPIENYLFEDNDGSKVLRISRITQVLSNGKISTQEQKFDLGFIVMDYFRKHVPDYIIEKVEITVDFETFEINAYRKHHLKFLIMSTLEWVIDNLMHS